MALFGGVRGEGQGEQGTREGKEWDWWLIVAIKPASFIQPEIIFQSKNSNQNELSRGKSLLFLQQYQEAQ